MQNKEILISPEKLIELKRSLQVEIDRRKNVKTVTKNSNKIGFIAKIKNIFKKYI